MLLLNKISASGFCVHTCVRMAHTVGGRPRAGTRALPAVERLHPGVGGIPRRAAVAPSPLHARLAPALPSNLPNIKPV